MSFKQLLYKVFIWRGVYLLSVFLLNIGFARCYGAGGSSIVYYLINLYSFVLLIASFSLESGMGFFLAKKEADPRSLAVFSIGWTIVASGLSFLLLDGWFLFFDPDVQRPLWTMSALTFIPGQLLITFFMALFYSKESAALPNILLAVVNFALIAGLPLARTSPSTYLTLYFIGTLIQGLLLAILFSAKYREARTNPTNLKKIFRYSLIAFIANIAFFLVYRVDYWFVKRYCAPEDLGNYIQVSKLGQLLLVLPGVLASAIFPGTALGKTANMPLYLGRMSRIAVLLFVLLFIILLAAGRQLFPLLFGPGFDKMYLPMLVILPGIFFLAILAQLSAWFGGMQRPAVSAGSAMAGLLVIVAGDWLFIPRYGIIAAAAVSTIGYFTCLLWSLLAFRKESNIGLSSLWIIKKEDWRWLKNQARDNVSK